MVEYLNQVSIGSLLTFVGGVFFVIGGLASAWVIWRLRSDEAWKKIAERRGVEIIDLEKEVARLTKKHSDSESDCERYEQRYSRAQAKVDWYERRYGPIPPDAL
jgi:hypothetical protein